MSPKAVRFNCQVTAVARHSYYRPCLIVLLTITGHALLYYSIRSGFLVVLARVTVSTAQVRNENSSMNKQRYLHRRTFY